MKESQSLASLALLITLALCSTSSIVGCAASPTSPPASAHAPTENVTPQIISPRVDGTARDLFQQGERAMEEQRWQDAADAFEALNAAEPKSERAPLVLLDLGAAYEQLGHREKARETYRTLERAFPEDRFARAALSREASIDAYLEDWVALGAVGDQILARKDIDDTDRMMGLGARGLSKIEAGDDRGASKDVQDGLDLAEAAHAGAVYRLPVPAAQLRFALGEIRRVRSEKIAMQPVTNDFPLRLELRCAGLLDAQNAYADAIRSVDTHWAAMSGFRIGEMYRALHRELMAIPSDGRAKTEHDRQLFYAIMHVRYRALLDKGVEMMRRTIALGEKTDDGSSWVVRAVAAKAEMESALADEKAQLAQFPFTEEEVEKALEIMKKKATKEKDEKENKQASEAKDAGKKSQ